MSYRLFVVLSPEESHKSLLQHDAAGVGPVFAHVLIRQPLIVKRMKLPGWLLKVNRGMLTLMTCYYRRLLCFLRHMVHMTCGTNNHLRTCVVYLL